MSTRTVSSTPHPTVPPEVLAFAREQDVEQCLPGLIALSHRVFPSAVRFEVLLEEDPEVADDRHIVFRLAVPLDVSQSLNLPIQMTVGQLTTEVIVSGEQELIQTTDSSNGLVFDPVKTQDLPLNGRQSYMLLALTPGVIFTQEQFGASGFSGTRGWDVNSSYKFNGARAGNSNDNRL